MKKIVNIILGSSRGNSLGRSLFNNLKQNKNEYENITGVKFVFIKLEDYHLPFFYEALPPMNNSHRELRENEQKWLNDMDAASGYIFLTPEYNHSFPGVLKNALDYLDCQGQQKPAKIVSYSDNGRGGQFGAADLAPVLMRLGFFVLPKFAAIGNLQMSRAV